ncbi:MAG: flagellar protein FlgN [Lachnospiraceae bacterium]|jgi:hypothetical protein|nr:flagellar protein FlgN [Lachnospiraceae bacterium]
MHDLTEFTQIIRQLIELFDRMIPLEQKKLEMVSQNQIGFLDDIVKKEQAEVLAMRGLEQKREKAQQKLGFQDLTFQEILERLPEEQRGEQKALFDELSSKVSLFRTITDNSKSIVEVNLHAINKTIAKRANGKTQTYAEDGSVKDGEIHFTDRRI